ncbi:MAG: hypothetical protein AB1765_04105 [Candidatus Hydrogenedentota bacterium]
MKNIFVIIYLLLCVLQSTTFCQNSDEKIILKKADYVIYKEDGTIDARGNVNLEYDTMYFIGDSVLFNTVTNQVTASGNINFFDKHRNFYGDYLNYDIKTGKGYVKNVETYFYPWFVNARDLYKWSSDLFEAREVRFTTCDEKLTHYFFQSDKVFIKKDDYLKAYNVLLKIWGIPVLYLPYYKKKFKDPTRWEFEQGRNTRDGYYFYATYNYDLNQDNKGKLHFDFRSKSGEGIGIDHLNRYTKNKFTSETLVSGYYVRDHYPDPENRFQLKLNNSSRLGKHYFFQTEVFKLSDVNFQEDYWFNDFRNNRSPRTIFLVARRTEHSTLQAFSELRLNKFLNTTEYKPSVSYNRTPYEIKNTGVIHQCGLSYSRIGLYSSLGDTDYHNAILANRFSRPFRVSFLNFEPYFDESEDWYDRRASDENDIIKREFNAGLNVSTRLKRYFYPSSRNIYKHTIQPVLGYNHQEIHSVNSYELVTRQSFLNENKSLNFSINNIVEKKDRKNKILTILRADFTANYTLEKQQYRWSPLSAKINFVPAKAFFLTGEVQYDFDRHYIPLSRLELNTIYKGASISLASLVREDQDIGNLYLTLSLPVIKKWQINMYHNYNTHQRHPEYYGIRIDRNLHCWNMVISFDDNVIDGEKRFGIGFYITEFPRFKMSF